MSRYNSRRKFIGTLAAGTGLAGLTAFSQSIDALAKSTTRSSDEADAWLKKNIKGDHRVVYDGPEPNDAFPIAWTWAYYLTNNQSGTTDDEMTGVCVLRHNGLALAMKDELWEKYKFGEMFNITDNVAKAPAVKNPYYEPRDGDFPVPGIDGIKRLQERGALFCACNLAITVFSGMVAQKMNLNPDEVKAEWTAGILPDIQIVPSGVWALGRAQEYGCGYIYAGG